MNLSAYLLHLRPKSFIPCFVLVFSGYALATSYPVSLIRLAVDFFAMFFIYGVFLWGGTSAINTYFDNDADRPLNYLDNPPPIPKYLGFFGLMMMLLSLPIAAMYSTQAVILCSFSIVLSLAYSAKIPGVKWRGKEIGILDNLISAMGSGLIAVLLGHAISMNTINSRIYWVALAFTLSTFGTYPMTQLHQIEGEVDYERERNYLSLVGVNKSFIMAFLCLLGCIGIIMWTSVLGPPGKYISEISKLFYIAFFLFYSFAAFFIIWWLKSSPRVDAKKRFNTLIKWIFLGRLFWIAAELVR